MPPNGNTPTVDPWSPVLLENALWYASRGWAVFPCHTATPTGCSCGRSACDSPGKHPRTLNGLKDASVDPGQITRWWTMWPTANIAMCTGAVSGLVVLDNDSYKGGDASLADLTASYQALPETIQQLTGGGGVHYLFAHPGHPVRNGVGSLGAGLDIRGDGGYIIAPPSLHPSGKRYMWEASSDPEETALAPWPAWLDALCNAPTSHASRVDASAPIFEHDRNNTLFRLGSSLRARGLSVDAIEAALQTMNQHQCVPPLSSHEVSVLARSNGRYPAGSLPEAPIPDASPAQIARFEATRRAVPLHAPCLTPPLPAPAVLPIPVYAPWLHHYVTHSAYWAPRAAPAYHAAVGLWVLSTIAARRIVVEMGSTPIYPTLFVALVSESTNWTKTTAAALGVRLLRRAGCGHLLAPDRTTPQFLLKLMAGIVPQDYGNKTEEEQQQAREVLGFAAQRGWFYEEWGGMLTQMRRVDSPHAELNKLLIVLEGGAETFETGTIQRGLERIEAPYLALLGNATPHDLAPFMMEGNAWWHDGFWPRFVCATPPYGHTPSLAPRPREAYHLPADLIRPLHDWHTRLGSPAVTIDEEREANGKLTGGWVSHVGELPRQAMTLTPEVYDAYEAYNKALVQLSLTPEVAPDLRAWYGRGHDKALRVAMLLASVEGGATITLPYWAQGQAIMEGWRANLHELVATVSAQVPLSREALLESKIEHALSLYGAMTAREVQRHTHNVSSELLTKTLGSMLKIDRISQVKNGRKILYTIFHEEDSDAE